MRQSGFYGMKTELWHYIVKNWKDFGPVSEVKLYAPAKIDGSMVR
jgi:hypothetical protein